jgi:hypothetical protein
MSSKEEIKKIIDNLTEDEIKAELLSLSKQPAQFKKDLNTILSNLSEKNIEQGIKRFGTKEDFINSVKYYIAIKSWLVRNGLKVGVAAGAAGVILYETHEFCHDMACSTGIEGLHDIGDGIKIASDICIDISSFGLDIVSGSVGFLHKVFDNLWSLFWDSE